MALLPVDDALNLLLTGKAPYRTETLPLHQAGGRILAKPLYASFNQPPYDGSAMDGYAIRAEDARNLPVTLQVIGESAAGSRFDGMIEAGQAVRIFTGAPMPKGADTVVIQENTTRTNTTVTILEGVEHGRHIRKKGLDFQSGDCLLQAGHIMDAASLSLAAAANHPRIEVYARPQVAILATGDELLPPGSVIGDDQIISSNSYGIAEIIRRNGGKAMDLGIVPDQLDRIEQAIFQARDSGADILVTIGGASVGDHDLVHKALSNCGVKLDFWKIAMRPGKPLMSGHLLSKTIEDNTGVTGVQNSGMQILGLPGNPVSSLVCGHVFLTPLVAQLAGQPSTTHITNAVLANDMPANGDRRDYARATLQRNAEGEWLASLLPVQDSSMLTVIARADALLIREPFAPAAQAGESCKVLLLG